MAYRIGIDTGGTFTDLVLVDDSGDVQLFKTPSTPLEPAGAIRNGLELIAERRALPIEELLQGCDMIIHGTTVALNALIQLNGAKVGLLCTRGHEDSLEIRNGHKEDGHRYNFRYPAAPMLVPRRLRVPVTERVLSDGSVRIPLDESDVRRGIELFRRENVDAVGISFLWSFLHPEHERRAAELVHEALPHARLTLSVDLLPQIREYTRTSTVAVNAYVQPRLAGYIDAVEQMLADLGYSRPIRYVQSNGGLTSAKTFVHRAVSALNSGPAAGPSAGIHYARPLCERNVLTLDMGGTSSDISLAPLGRVDLVRDVDVGRYRIGIPLVNVISVGAGGGSIAWLDPQRMLHVGPQSAEAVPGPACYMRGGTEPTVTDALVVLGYLNPTALLGGRMPIDAATARRAIDQRVAEPLRISRERAAVGIFNVVNANMAAGIRSVSIERGHDPRDFTLVAGGGATSAHAGRLMSELGLKSTIIPRVASGLCAFGEAVADVKHTHLASYTTPLETLEPEKLDAILLELEERGRSELSEEGFVDEQIFFERSLDMKYVDQVHECSVPIPRFTVTRDRVADIAEAFHRRHEALYTYCERDNMPELINVEVNVFGRFPPLAVAGGAVEGSAVPSAIAHRDCFFEEYGDYRRTPVYRGNDLLAGDAVEGPAIVEEETTTIVVFPGLVLSVTTAEAYLMRALTNFG